MHIITAWGSSMPFIIRNSRVLSSMAESEPVGAITGRTLPMSSSDRQADCMVSSRASIRSALPRMVLISPLCMMYRLGWARCQLGFVLVENREWTRAMALSQSGSVRSA